MGCTCRRKPDWRGEGASLYLGDCREVMNGFPVDTFDSVVTDPPYGIKFMGKKWDHGVPGVGFWTRALRVAKPGAHLLAFGGTRTFHRLAVAIEDAGWEIRDCMMWVYGTGFPKSKGVLRPAWEPILVARKPPIGSVASNQSRYGTGPMSVEACRIERIESLNGGAYSANGKPRDKNDGWRMNRGGAGEFSEPLGGWPANLIHDGSEEVVSLFPVSKRKSAGRRVAKSRLFGVDAQPEVETGYGDSGSAARFFYCAKASKREREEGCKNRQAMSSQKMGNGLKSMVGHPSGKEGNTSTEDRRCRNPHPTIKPIALMRYLCRLATPPGGIVLDPFMGSGSTGKAAVREGFRFVGIEIEQETFEVSVARIGWEIGR